MFTPLYTGEREAGVAYRVQECLFSFAVDSCEVHQQNEWQTMLNVKMC